jgi:hypothetical protein
MVQKPDLPPDGAPQAVHPIHRSRMHEWKEQSMNRLSMLVLAVTMALMVACGGAAKKPFHDAPLGDPMQYKAHFGDIDTNGDEMVKWYEFKKYFPQAEPKVFMALDLNDDAVVDHDEWHEFKEAHGMKDHHD